MLKNRARRSGFTLPEVLVTVAIVAVLAAVVVPAVTQQLGRGDAPAFNSSVNSLRTAITSFAADVRRLPGKVDDLQTKPTISTDFSLSDDGLGAAAGTSTTAPAGIAFTTAFADRWRGPYENSGNATGEILVGFDWTTTNVLYDSLNYVVVAMTKSGAVITDAEELDAAVDGGNGADLGLVRWFPGTAPALDPPATVRLFLMSSAR